MVINIHYRDLNATVDEVGAILDSLSTAEQKPEIRQSKTKPINIVNFWVSWD